VDGSTATTTATSFGGGTPFRLLFDRRRRASAILARPGEVHKILASFNSRALRRQGETVKKSGKKLQFTKEKVRELTEPQLDEVAGGLQTTALSCGGSCESQCFSCGPAC
jgi:hypothetical protein